ncbi:hypothetical protein [Campylobacter sp. RM15925]|uniref:hypothetical protein n=1 Tax=Campylobacter sp. RM15925 TaxID=1705724 RepID=UPI0014730CA4|nr:hypothetical protein [Campylobacter sp. RM15925]
MRQKMKRAVLAVFLAFSSLNFAFADSKLCDSKDMKEMLFKLNKNAPEKIDDSVTLMGAECKEGVLTYKYELKDSANFKILEFKAEDIENFKYKQSAILGVNYCNAFRGLHAYTQKVIWLYEFGGKKFAEFGYTPKDCKSYVR